jgi:hypothetical protein
VLAAGDALPQQLIVRGLAHAQAAADLSTAHGRRLLAHCIAAGRGSVAVPDGRCGACLGSHPPELCGHATEAWTCAQCNSGNASEGTGRYVCASCLTVRPAVMDCDDWSEVWECPDCQRATPCFEDACAFCPHVRPAAAAAAAADGDDDTLPFFPAKCGVCGEVHLEALCPLCAAGDVVRDQIRRGRGVVCVVMPAYAFIQPWGTAGHDWRVFVPRSVLAQGSVRHVGQSVQFDASKGSKGQLRATMVAID